MREAARKRKTQLSFREKADTVPLLPHCLLRLLEKRALKELPEKPVVLARFGRFFIQVVLRVRDRLVDDELRVGVGEKIDDLQKFNSGDFVNALFQTAPKKEGE